jgi:hypothetical protein
MKRSCDTSPPPRLSPGCIRQVCRHYYTCPHLVKLFYRFFVKKNRTPQKGEKSAVKTLKKYRDPLNGLFLKAGTGEGAGPDKRQIKYIIFKKKMQAASMLF